MNNFKFRQEITEEDFLAFYKLHMTRTMLRPINIIMAALFMVVLVLGPFFGSPETLYYGIGFVFLIGFLYFYMNRQGKKMYNKDPESFHMDYVLNDNSIKFSSKDGKSEKMWSEFDSMIITDEFVFIYLKNKRGLIFKKEYLGEDATNFIIERVKKEVKPQKVTIKKEKQQ